MMEEMKNAEPVLTLNPFEEMTAQPQAPAVPEQKTEAAVKETREAAVFDESTLTIEERKMVNEFADSIDLKNSTVVLQYGAGAQKKIADFSETALANVRSKDLGEIGELLSNVVYELKKFDEEEEKGFLGIFKKSGNKIAAMKSKYDKAEVNINKICDVLEEHQIQLLKDTAMLDKMYDLIDDMEGQLSACKERKKAIEAEKLTGDNIYKILVHFDRLYAVMEEADKRALLTALVKEIQIYEEEQPNGQWLKSITFLLPAVEEGREIGLDNDKHVETVCLLSNRKPDTKVRIDVDLEDYYCIKDAKKNQN